ncbi:MAG: c-type cytochrome [Spongiibacteraceae bacterium]
MSIKKSLMVIGLTALGSFHAVPAISSDSQQADLAKGKYLVQLGGCNDCHTAGYAPSGAQTPVQNWLLGDSLGYKGPWGTTYPTNLRQFIQNFSEAQWIAYAQTMKTRPPMPWWVLNAMTTDDLAAIYKFIKSLGPSVATVPSYVAPGQPTKAPYIQWPEPPK